MSGRAFFSRASLPQGNVLPHAHGRVLHFPFGETSVSPDGMTDTVSSVCPFSVVFGCFSSHQRASPSSSFAAWDTLPAMRLASSLFLDGGEGTSPHIHFPLPEHLLCIPPSPVDLFRTGIRKFCKKTFRRIQGVLPGQ